MSEYLNSHLPDKLKKKKARKLSVQSLNLKKSFCYLEINYIKKHQRLQWT